jgi:hypothetical protein
VSDLLKRRGTFKIKRDLIMEHPEYIMEVLKDVLIVSIENDFMTDSLKYKGYSEHFDLVSCGEMAPGYINQVQKINRSTQNVDATIFATWFREKEYSEKSVKDMLLELKTAQEINVHDFAKQLYNFRNKK